MPTYISAPGHGLYNTIIALLKFLLAPLGVCVVVLFGQLHITFPAPYALLDATASTQFNRDRVFHVGFYALHVFAHYDALDVTAAAVFPPDSSHKTNWSMSMGDLYLTAKGRSEVPFYAGEFKLPAQLGAGTYNVSYAVTFHGRKDLRVAGETKTFTYDPQFVCVNALEEDYAVFVRRGQHAQLPSQWTEMELSPSGGQDVKVETHTNLPNPAWLWALPSLGEGTHRVELQSALFVEKFDPKDNLVTTTRGTKVYFDAKTRFLPRCGGPRIAAEIQHGDRIAFTNRPDHIADAVLITPPALAAGADIVLTLLVGPNQPPQPVYARNGPGVVVAFTGCLFGGGADQFFNLNRDIVDPDGQDQSTYEPSIRVTRMTLLGGLDAADFALTRDRDSGDFLLSLTPAGIQWLRTARPGATRQVRLAAGDELVRPPLVVSIIHG
jgi:hypothetical protein